MKAFGGTYEQYLDTSEEAIEALIRIDDAFNEAASRASSAPAPQPGPSEPRIS
jgi:hypothetical protein